MKNYRNSKSDFVFEIFSHQLTDDEILKGFVLWYVLEDKTVNDLMREMVYNSNGYYTGDEIKRVCVTVTDVLKDFVGN